MVIIKHVYQGTAKEELLNKEYLQKIIGIQTKTS
jgi:hypothetical protein